jgi:hypothetical protein
MSNKRESINNTTKKRCPNGFRRDKKTDICVKYATIKKFENLSEQTISETKDTLSLESLGKDGTILKTYQRGELKHQFFVSDEKLQKAKKKAQKDIQKILKMMHNIQKDPSKIDKDTKFKRVLKKIKGGGSSTIQSNTDILIEEGVMDKIETKAVVKLEDKIENIENIENIDKIDKIENIDTEKKKENSWLDNIWGSIGSNWEAIMTIIHVADVAGLSYALGKSANIFTPFSMDLVGSMAIVVMNIMYAYYPEEGNKQYTLYTQYLIYSFILGSSLFVGPIGLISNFTMVFTMGFMGLLYSFIDQYDLNTTNEKLENIKRDLVDVLENPQ